jgi:hypothetical protein
MPIANTKVVESRRTEARDQTSSRSRTCPNVPEIVRVGNGMQQCCNQTLVLQVNKRWKAGTVATDLNRSLCDDCPMGTSTLFDQLLDEGNAEPIDGWDFSWFHGRATEARPSWKYSEGLSKRMDRAGAVLDVQTGGGERFAEALQHVSNRPAKRHATESWSANVAIAHSRLAPLGVTVHAVPDTASFPFQDETFDLVCSRHPTVTQWAEIARVLQIEGTYYSQQIGAGTNRELIDFMMGPQPVSETRRLDRAVSLANSVGLEVINAQMESLTVEFFDVGAVVYFLRKVIWTVPEFSTDTYRERLKLMHDHIEVNGSFVSHSQRYLIEAKK